MVEPSSFGKEVILITGITGYVGSQVAKQILDLKNDRFKIRASVRSLLNDKKLVPLRKAFGEEGYASIEFVEADLMSKEALIKAIQGVSYIIHVASPLPGATKLKDEEMLIPAVEGMKAILEAAEA
jgi:dihydroflavonol-4-reductase